LKVIIYKNNNINIHISNVIEESFQEYPPYISMIIFVSKCNLNCYRCPNKSVKSYKTTTNELINKLESNPLLDALIVLGGEPTTCSTEIEDILQQAKHKGKLTKIFTNGCRPNVIKDWLGKGLLNAVSIDLKTLSKFEKISGTDITSITYLNVFNECINVIQKFPSVQLEVRTTELRNSDSSILTDIKEIKDYMKLHYFNVKHIIQDDTLEYTQ